MSNVEMSSKSNSEANGSESDSPNVRKLVEVKVEELMVGREIQFSILDHADVLLLSEGTVITSEFKNRLRERNIISVRLHESDAKGLKYRVDDSHADDSNEQFNFDKIVSEKLSTAVCSGLPFVTNSGPSVKETIARNLDKYDEAQQLALMEEHRSNAVEMHSMMSDIAHGDVVDGQKILEFSKGYLKHLSDDINNFTTSAFLLGQDRTIARHAMSMSVIAMGMGVEMGLNEDNVHKIGVTALLHDWGMMKVPRSLRDPDHKLTELEMFEVQKHPMHSVNILETAVELPALVPLLSYQVHERLDGSGYPRRRTEQSIHLFARILNVAHEYTELTTKKRYRPAYSPYTAMSMLLNPPGSRCHDPLMMRVLLRLNSLFPVGSFVALSDGSTAKVLRGNGDFYTQPIVQIVRVADGQIVEDENDVVNLRSDGRTITKGLRTPGTDEIIEIPEVMTSDLMMTPREDIKLVSGPHWKQTRTRDNRPVRRRVVRRR